MSKDYLKMSKDELVQNLQDLNAIITRCQGVLSYFTNEYKACLLAYNLVISNKLDEVCSSGFGVFDEWFGQDDYSLVNKPESEVLDVKTLPTE